MNKVGIIVGHTHNEPGAMMTAHYKQNEYSYNLEIASICFQEARFKGIQCKVILRDKIGIKGAYEVLDNWIGADRGCSIELHFNSEASNKAQGTETLYSLNHPDSKLLASIVQEHMVICFMRDGKFNRGIKEIVDTDRGARNLSYSKFPSVIVEPFFGSNVVDAKMGMDKKSRYAICLISACEEFFK